jgi:ParB/RepB/Spo0J family partition protein
MDSIVVSELNVRKTEKERDIEGLADNIQRQGLLQPIVVVKKGDVFDLIIGQRRYLAVKRLGWKEIPAMILGEMDSIRSTILSLSENIQRRELPYRDMVDACDILYQRYHNINVIADELGVSPPTVQHYLTHRLVPEPIKQMVEEKKISRQAAHDITLATMSSIVKGDIKKPVKLAEMIAAMPPQQQRKVIENTQRNPDLSAEDVVKSVRKLPKDLKIVITLPDRFKRQLEKAAESMEMDVEEVVKTALIQWLNASGYAPVDEAEEDSLR